MRRGNKAVQTNEELRTHGSGGGGQQNMGCQTTKVSIVSLGVSCGLRHHHPERILGTVFHQILVDAVTVQFQRLTEDCADNACGLCILQAADGGHDRQMELGSRGDVLCHRSHTFTAVDAVKEFSIALYHAPHGGIVRQAHLVHPDGVQVCPEFLAV